MIQVLELADVCSKTPVKTPLRGIKQWFPKCSPEASLQHHLGTCWKYKICSLTADHMNRELWAKAQQSLFFFKGSPDDSDAH